jgi:PAS domain S-box-containing protein
VVGSFILQESLALCLTSILAVAEQEACGGAIYLRNQDGTQFALSTWQDSDDDTTLRLSGQYAADSERGRLLRLGIPFAINCRRPNTTYPVLLSDDEGTVTVLPLMLRSQPLGSLDLMSPHHSGLSSATTERLVPLANRLASLAMHVCCCQGIQIDEGHCPAFVETVGNLFLIVDTDGRILWTNETLSTALCYRHDELLGRPLTELHPPHRRREARRALHEIVSGTRTNSHIPFLRRDGSTLCNELTATRGRWHDRNVIIVVGRAVNECGGAVLELEQSRDSLEQAVNEQQARLLSQLRLQSTMACVSRELLSGEDQDASIALGLRLFGERLGADHACLYRSSAEQGAFSRSHEWHALGRELDGMPAEITPESLPWWTRQLRDEGCICLGSVASLPPEAAAERDLLDGQAVVSAVAVGISYGDQVRGFIQLEFGRQRFAPQPSTMWVLRLFADALGNALERAEAERKVRDSEKLLRGILADTDALICRFDPDGTIRFINQAAAEFLGYNADRLPGDNAFMLIPDDRREAIRTSFQSLTPDAPVHTRERLSVRKDGTARLLRWTERAFFSADGTPLHYQAVAIDISDLAQARRDAVENLRHVERTLRNAVRALAKTQEIRDPYTAGHQLRVADLSVAIARLLGMPEAQQSEVYYGALLHDLGKIRVPMDILSKPGRLTDAEFSLIQCHPDSGLDILREIHLAEAVELITVGHHERLDGSGYPAGLKGDEICIGARIVAVADVVDSMVSYRSYRPALPVSEALAEITKHSGTKYDRNVVDACLDLFVNHGYEFPDPNQSQRAAEDDGVPPPPVPATAPACPVGSYHGQTPRFAVPQRD